MTHQWVNLKSTKAHSEIDWDSMSYALLCNRIAPHGTCPKMPKVTRKSFSRVDMACNGTYDWLIFLIFGIISLCGIFCAYATIQFLFCTSRCGPHCILTTTGVLWHILRSVCLKNGENALRLQNLFLINHFAMHFSPAGLPRAPFGPEAGNPLCLIWKWD